MERPEPAHLPFSADDPVFGTLFEHGTDGVLIARPDGTILRANPAACRLLGRTEAELRTIERDELVVGDERLRAFLDERARNGVAHGELLHRLPDGSVYTADVTSVVLPGAEGSPFTLVLFRDVSARRAADEALRKYELLAAHGRDAMLFVRRDDGRILEANAAAVAMYRLSREELLARSVLDLRAPSARAEVPTQLAEADTRGTLFETMHRRADGTPFPVEVSSQGATIGGERILLSVVRDITIRRRAEDALRESDRRKSEFLAMLSHELRNPLAPILNGVELLRVGGLPDAAERARAIIERQARHLARLVDDLLDATRIARGRVALAREVLDAGELARRVAEDHRALFEERAVVLRIELPAGPLWIDADPTRVAQAIGNLLHNAAKFTPEGAAATLSASPGPAGVELSVRDEGAGIDGALMAHLFQPFVQGERTLARTRGGLGLGLAVVKGLVELHGGSVRAESAGPGRGATFTLVLPGAAAPGGSGGGGTAEAARPSGPRTVLIVEDNADAADTLADLLRLDGHEVHVARDGRSGLELAHAVRPDVVLCDLGLPDVSGYEVARALRADGALAATLLVALSGYAQAEDREQALAAGFDAHLPKPPPLDRLAALVAG